MDFVAAQVAPDLSDPRTTSFGFRLSDGGISTGIEQATATRRSLSQISPPMSRTI